MAETDEWAQRACLRIAEVTVIHSVVTKATGSTAMGKGEVDMTVEGGRGGERINDYCSLFSEGLWNLRIETGGFWPERV